MPNVLGEMNTKRTVMNVAPIKMAELKECVRNIELTRREEEARKGVSVNRSFCKYR